MRIAVDATYTVDQQPSGIAVYSRNLLSGLVRNYPQHEFLFCYRPKQWLRGSRLALPRVQSRLLMPPVPAFRADLFHGLNQRVDRRPARRVVSTFHDLFVMTEEYSSPDFRARFAEQARRAAQNSDLIIAVSEFTAAQVTTLLGVPSARIRIVPHGVDPPANFPELAREDMILFVGALQIRKNVVRLIEAFEWLCGRGLDRDWRLVLAGAQSGYQAQHVLERVRNSACRDRIELAGYVPEQQLQALYARASIFVLPSLDEGFGIPVIEAMAYGVPVITSNRSALPEVAGDAALLVSPYSVEELECGLSRLIQEPHLRQRLAKLGRERAQLYTWDRAVRETYSVYRELMRRTE